MSVGTAQVGLNTVSRLVKIRLSDGSRWVLHETTPALARELAADLARCAAAAETKEPAVAFVEAEKRANRGLVKEHQAAVLQCVLRAIRVLFPDIDEVDTVTRDDGLCELVCDGMRSTAQSYEKAAFNLLVAFVYKHGERERVEST